jgi:hypothetical protein
VGCLFRELLLFFTVVLVSFSQRHVSRTLRRLAAVLHGRACNRLTWPCMAGCSRCCSIVDVSYAYS